MTTQLFDKVFPIQFAKDCLQGMTLSFEIIYRNQVRARNSLKICVRLASFPLLEKVILNIVEKHIEERSLLNAFRVRHSTTLQCMRLTNQTLNFNNNMSTTAVFLDIETASDTTWHSGLLYVQVI
jgi:hypothetical protein